MYKYFPIIYFLFYLNITGSKLLTVMYFGADKA